ncbi:MAG: surface lipoprotein assembly modifier [Desulfovibrio sp.]|jgi:hypothetical protein|nr:surface lipoprotein assembly modifier [Desulfovibrio sp.]
MTKLHSATTSLPLTGGLPFRRFIRILFPLAALLLLPALAAAATDDPLRRGATDQLKVEAASLLRKGDADTAYEMYKRLLRSAADDDEVCLGLARSATAAKRWNQSVLAYEMLLERHPGEAGLYGELANVYMLIGDKEAAERSLVMQRALAGKAGQDADRTLDALERRYDQFQIHGKLRAGLLYDSNVNMGPNSEDMDLGNWRVKVEDADRKGSFGAYLGADLDLGWRPLRDSGWWLVGDAKGFWRGYENSDLHDSLHSRESQWGRAALGARHVGSKTLLDLRFKAEIFDFEFLQHVAGIGPEASFLYALTPSIQLISSAGLDSRTYSESKERNGGYGWIGEYLRFFFGQDNHEFIVGGRFLGAATNRDDYSYEGWEGSARFLFKLPHGVELAPFASWTQEYYHGPATILETENRFDNRWRLGASATWRLDEAWALELAYQYTSNDSASPLYDYTQHLVTAGVSWSF